MKKYFIINHVIAEVIFSYKVDEKWTLCSFPKDYEPSNDKSEQTFEVESKWLNSLVKQHNEDSTVIYVDPNYKNFIGRQVQWFDDEELAEFKQIRDSSLALQITMFEEIKE